MNKRLRELDFLRGIAILLVLLCHIRISPYTSTMGWIGVDLFFVLSGYLVSGLLFKEYLKFGHIRPKLFLIRRGFKIYPIYYLFYIPYLLIILLIPSHTFSWKGFLADMTFTQNYITGWGYAYYASWSLAVEEHFYFGFSLLLWLAIQKNWFQLKDHSKRNSFVRFIITIFFVCLGLRIVLNLCYPNHPTQLFTMTHLRIDSLLMGVLIGYYSYLRPEVLTHFFETQKRWLYAVIFLGLCWTPFIKATDSFFAMTFGFTLIYLAFGSLLLSFLQLQNINRTLDSLFTKPIVNGISRIGYCSYSIYIIHTLMVSVSYSIFKRLHLDINEHQILFFIPTVTASVSVGMLMTYKIEKYFLQIRNRYYPANI
ncbi:acyltransferase family protein [Flavobacterium sp. XGLA_31]|uniref:acyltransferase family protein n=1 Tax=Flavobacterium sp. XGLA_31 TaxID=3447666 RepID=UPI003F3A0492